jgi:hypothetical protein
VGTSQLPTQFSHPAPTPEGANLSSVRETFTVFLILLTIAAAGSDCRHIRGNPGVSPP